MRCVLFTGKGGVGTSTVAAATATLAAQRGNRTLVMSVEPGQGLAAVLDHPLGDIPVEIESGLYAQQMDVQRSFEEHWQAVRGSLDLLWATMGTEPVEIGELMVLPGAGEMFALLRLLDRIGSGEYDVVVVDSGPTAQLLRLLTLPETVAWYLRRLVPADGRLARLMRGGPRLRSRADWPGTVPEQLVGLATRLQGVVTQAREVLADPVHTSVRVVLTPETVVVGHAREALTALALHGFAVDAMVANRVHMDAGSDAWRAGWAAVHRDQLREVELSFAPVKVLRAAYRAGEPVGLEELAAFAAAAYTGLDPVGVLGAARGTGPGTGSPQVERMGDSFSISLGLPFVQRSQIGLARIGEGELMVSVGSQRRLLTLPSALRRCDVSGASLRDDRLVVSFVPNPDLWMQV